MKLVHPDFFCQIPILETQASVLILESPEQFLKFTSEIRHQCDGNKGEWVLSDNSVPLKFSQNCEIIFDLFSIERNQKKIIQTLYTKLEKELWDSELLFEWNSIYTYLSQFMDKLLERSEYSLNYRESLELKDFFKWMNLSFDESGDDPVEKLIDYLTLMSEIVGVQLFVLCNIKSYLNIKQLKYLYEQAFYKKFRLLLVESRHSNNIPQMEKTIIIDKDNCLI